MSKKHESNLKVTGLSVDHIPPFIFVLRIQMTLMALCSSLAKIL